MKAFHPVMKRLRLRRLPLLVLLLLVISSGFDAQAQFPKAQASTDQELASLEAQLRTLETQWHETALAFRNTLGDKQEKPVDRIARIDQWMAEQRVTLDAVDALNRQIAEKKVGTAGTTNPITKPTQRPILSDPVLNEITEIHTAIFEATAPLREAELSPLDRIAWIDEFQSVNKPLFQLLAEKERMVSARTVETADFLPIHPGVSPGLTPAEQSRANQATSRLREIFERANTLSPVDRIAALDAASKDIRESVAELKTLQEKQNSKP